MRKIYLLLIASLTIVSCQIEESGTPTPDESFIKYYGSLSSYEAVDIEYLNDSSGFVIFGNVVGNDGATDFSVIRVDLEGNLIDSASISIDIPLRDDFDGDGTDDILAGNNLASQIEVLEGGGYIYFGTTLLNDNNIGIQNENVAVVQVLDENLVPVRVEEEDSLILFFAGGRPGLGLDFFGEDVIIASDGSLVLVGSIEVDRGGSTDFDYQITKITGQGDGFAEVVGVPGEDEFAVRIFEKANGNFVVIGYSDNESSLGENDGSNGVNVEFTEFTAGGQPVNSISYGVDNPNNNTVFNEQVYDVIETASGYAIAGTSTLATEETYAFFMNLSSNGLLLSADTLTSAFRIGESQASIQTNGFGIVQGSDNNFIVLGQYPNFTYEVNVDDPFRQPESRAGEAMFMKVSQSGQPLDEFENNFGTADGDDFAVDALSLPDGKIMMLANIDFGGGIRLVSLVKLNKTGNLED